LIFPLTFLPPDHRQHRDGLQRHGPRLSRPRQALDICLIYSSKIFKSFIQLFFFVLKALSINFEFELLESPKFYKRIDLKHKFWVVFVEAELQNGAKRLIAKLKFRIILYFCIEPILK